LKFNKIAIVGILLLAILIVGAVSAADENVTDTTEDVLSVESADDDLITESPGDFSELSGLIKKTNAGETLYLDKDYVQNNYESIHITKAITVDGNGHTLDFNKLSATIYVSCRGVAFKNIQFINGSCFIYSYQSDYGLSVYDCSFEGGCTSSNHYAAVSYGNAYNCSFVNCNDGKLGGAIEGNAYNCSFVDCSSLDSGGAVYGNAYNCSFVECSTRYMGGAVYGNAYNCSFVDCSSSGSGGAVCGNAYDSYFVNCSTKYSDAAICKGTASKCTFINCRGFAVINSVIAKNVNYGNDAIIEFYGTNAGTVDVTVNGKSYTIKPEYFGRSITLSGLNAGTYTVQAIYSGSANYEAQNVTTSFRVKKLNPISKVKIDKPSVNSNGNYQGRVQYTGTNSTLNITMVKSNVPGNVHVKVNGVSQKVKISGSILSVSLGVLETGHNDIEVKYGGSANFNAQTITISLDVVSQFPIKSIKVTPTNPSNKGQIKFTYNSSKLFVYLKGSDVPGSINVTINGASYIRDTYGKSTLSFALGIMKPGSYDIKVSYAGSEDYADQVKTLSFNVVKANSINSLKIVSPELGEINYGDSVDIRYAKSSTLYIYMNNFNVNNNTKMAPGRVHVTINDVTKAISINDTVLKFPLTALQAGSNSVRVVYAGNTYYASYNHIFALPTYKADPDMEVCVTPGYNTSIMAEINDDINGNIHFTIFDENNVKVFTGKGHIEEGVATCDVQGLDVGKYSLRSYFAGNARYHSKNVQTIFRVTDKTPLAYADLSGKYGQGATVDVNNANDYLLCNVCDDNHAPIISDNNNVLLK